MDSCCARCRKVHGKPPHLVSLCLDKAVAVFRFVSLSNLVNLNCDGYFVRLFVLSVSSSVETQFLQTLCAWSYGFPSLVHIKLIRKILLNWEDCLFGYVVTLFRIPQYFSHKLEVLLWYGCQGF